MTDDTQVFLERLDRREEAIKVAQPCIAVEELRKSVTTTHCSKCGERITTPTFYGGAAFCGLCSQNL